MRRASIALTALLLAACAAHQGTMLPELGERYSERQAALAGIADWQLKGRIGLRTADDGFSGSLLWRQQGETLFASLHGPLGAGAMRLNGTEERIRVEQGNGDILMLERPEQALAEHYGWTVPVGSFRYWVLGIADPRSSAELDVGGEGLLNGLTQGDWQVVYRAYQEVGGEQLPKSLTARNGDIRMTVSIRDWRIPYR